MAQVGMSFSVYRLWLFEKGDQTMSMVFVLGIPVLRQTMQVCV